MKKLAFILILGLVAFCVFGDHWITQNGQDLNKGWQSWKQINIDNQAGDSLLVTGLSSATFLGYLEGVLDSAHWSWLPGNVLTEQMIIAVGRWTDNHPEEWNLAAPTVIRHALEASFMK